MTGGSLPAALAANWLAGAWDQNAGLVAASQMSRRARGVEIWAALRALGRSGLADLIERTCR